MWENKDQKTLRIRTPFTSELPDNKNLIDKELTLKVAIPLALILASRIGGLHRLDTRFMMTTEDKCIFQFNKLHKLHKLWQQGPKPPFIVFLSYQYQDLCIVATGRVHIADFGIEEIK